MLSPPDPLLCSLVAEGGLTTLHCCFSRDPPERKTYVQDALREDAAAVARLIVECGAAVYVCGDGMQLLKAVQNALEDVLAKEAGQYLPQRLALPPPTSSSSSPDGSASGGATLAAAASGPKPPGATPPVVVTADDFASFSADQRKRWAAGYLAAMTKERRFVADIW